MQLSQFRLISINTVYTTNIQLSWRTKRGNVIYRLYEKYFMSFLSEVVIPVIFHMIKTSAHFIIFMILYDNYSIFNQIIKYSTFIAIQSWYLSLGYFLYVLIARNDFSTSIQRPKPWNNVHTTSIQRPKPWDNIVEALK